MKSNSHFFVGAHFVPANTKAEADLSLPNLLLSCSENRKKEKIKPTNPGDTTFPIMGHSTQRNATKLEINQF